ncbi:MAG: Na/Pi cotransporter family protein [Lachnospiraceae bacterium]|jgi:phosphate:Na+ symporter|nr:Na/Pi cotransporter family protein [Lachnospiraceae bacterium]
MSYLNIILPFVGGLGMFIYGMQIMASGLENAAGNKMKSVLEALTKNKLMGVLLGATVTAIIQSSSATTVMVVGFVNAGIMNLVQAMGVIMGANIGTTVTAWLVSANEWAKFLSPEKLAPIAIMVGVIILLMAKKSSAKEVASIIIGFGLLFIGIQTMSGAVAPLKESEGFKSIFVTLGVNPFLGILAGALVTAIIQSSSASVGILQSLAAVGLVPFNAAIYIIMGQNIGTCVTALLSSIGAKKNAKTAAFMHLTFNIVGTVIFTVFAIVYFKVINPAMGLGSINQTEISLAHTAFNIGTTVVLFPLSGYIIKIAKKITGYQENTYDESKVLLDDRMLETPSIAVQAAFRETLRMGEVVKRALEKSKDLLFTRNKEDIVLIKEDEHIVDKLCSGISDYVIKVSSLNISEAEHQTVAHLLQVLSDMERVSDYCENITEFTEHLIDKKLKFTEVASTQLKEMGEVINESYVLALECFEGNDKEIATKVIEKETRADDLEITIRSKHIKRLASGECDSEAGVVFLDALVCFERISDHARNIAEEVLEK